jgi:hypothetical protein
MAAAIISSSISNENKPAVSTSAAAHGISRKIAAWHGGSGGDQQWRKRRENGNGIEK